MKRVIAIQAFFGLNFPTGKLENVIEINTFFARV